MDFKKEILNDGLHLSMEFGENWLTPIHDRLSELYPELTTTALADCGKLCRAVNKYAHQLIRNNPVKNGDEIRFMESDEFKEKMKAKYHWIDEENLQRLYSQSCYYAWK